MPIDPITPIVAFPQTHEPDFAVKADAFVSQMATLTVPEMNASITGINAAVVQVEADAAETAANAALAQGAAAIVATGNPIGFITQAAMLADTVLSLTAGPGLEVVAVGSIIPAGGYRYVVRASGGQYTTAGGLSLDFAPGQVYPRDMTTAGVGIVGTVLRQAEVGDGWGHIGSTEVSPNHPVLGYTPTVSVVANQIQITPTGAPDANVATIVAPDEFYAQTGLFCGASVGSGPAAVTKINFAMNASVKLRVTDAPDMVGGNSFHTPEMSVHWHLASYTLSGITGAPAIGSVVTAGGVSCVVRYFNGTRMDVSGQNNATDRYAPLPASGAVTGAGFSATIAAREITRCYSVFHLNSPTNNEALASYNPSNYRQYGVRIDPQRISATETRFYPVASALGTRIYYSGGWLTAGGRDRDQNGANAWTFAWNAGDQSLTVTHPEVFDAAVCNPVSADPSVFVSVSTLTTTSFKVRFFDTATMALLSAESTKMNFQLNRGEWPLYEPWTGHANLQWPVLTLNPENVANANGNAWVWGAYADSPGIIA